MRVDHGVFGYPQSPAGLKESVVEWLHRRHAWEVNPDALVFIPGVVTAEVDLDAKITRHEVSGGTGDLKEILLRHEGAMK